ncbi:MAG: M20/M25/M40 family metallo-hydrolase [Candidatus Cryptobacteroides sp.]
MENIGKHNFYDILELLAGMVRIPSFSREEGQVADLVERWLQSHGLKPHRIGANIWLDSDDITAGEPVPGSAPEAKDGSGVCRRTILLNAHIDTVRPATGYTKDPFQPETVDGKLYGLGTNDDGGSFAATLSAFLTLSFKPQKYRLIWSATAEEEVCGRGGIEAVFPLLGKIDLGIIGEPTKMEMAVAEKGLMVLDCISEGRSGHAAREEGINAIYRALPDIEWFRNYRFPKVSPYLGPVKMTVTQINAGTQHNIVPDRCSFVVDVRSNGMYSNPELLGLIKSSVSCSVKERSTRLGSSHIDEGHPIVKRAVAIGVPLFGSSTTSNQTLSPFPTVKIGPGDSARSHTADEFIYIDEIREGTEIYVSLLDGFDF